MPSELPPPLKSEFCTVTPTGRVWPSRPWTVTRPSKQSEHTSMPEKVSRSMRMSAPTICVASIWAAAVKRLRAIVMSCAGARILAPAMVSPSKRRCAAVCRSSWIVARAPGAGLIVTVDFFAAPEKVP